MNTYKQAQNVYENSRKRKMANNTYLVKTDKGYGIRLHDTIVVEYWPDRTILRTGGWQTVTTKDRLNCFGPVGSHIYSDCGVWYISNGQRNKENRVVFADECYQDTNGKWHNTGPDPKKIQAKRKAAGQYAKAFIAKLIKREIPQPSGGDCWHCCMTVSAPDKDKGKSLGEATKDKSHIESHIDEKYYVPSLLLRACEAMAVSQAARHCVGYWLGLHDQQCKPWENIARQQLTSAIRRYCLREMGLSY